MVEALGDKAGKIAILSGIPGVVQLENRMKGFVEKIEEAGHEIVSKEFAHSDITQNLATVNSQLLSHPEINGFFGVGGDHAPSIIKVLDENGKLGDVLVVGFDDDPATIQGVKDGAIAATVVQRQYLWGYGGVIYGYVLAKGENDTGLHRYRLSCRRQEQRRQLRGIDPRHGAIRRAGRKVLQVER